MNVVIDALYFVLSLVLTQLIPEFVESCLLGRVLADPGIPVREFSLELGAGGGLNDFVECLSFLPARCPLDESTSLRKEDILGRKFCKRAKYINSSLPVRTDNTHQSPSQGLCSAGTRSPLHLCSRIDCLPIASLKIEVVLVCS